MQMLLNNGTILSDAPSMSEQTREYLNQFWSFPSSEKIKKEKEKYYLFECRREIHRNTNPVENVIEP